MVTELQISQSARAQYRAAFKTMAADPGRRWHLFAHRDGIVLLPSGDELMSRHYLVVQNVQAMTEETMINKLSIAYRLNKPECWSI